MRENLLSGVKVIEFGQIASGPFASSLLADLGADVVKVENPQGGDGMRNWPPFSANTDDVSFSENFASLNRNKRSLAVDLKNEADKKKLFQLIRKADVLIENFRSGALSRIGLGYEQLKAENPRLVYCSITGYGQKGPYAKMGAFDVTVQAMSGLMSVTGDEGGTPVKCGVPVGDFCAGLYAAYTILAALREAEKTGEGTFIDCSMLGALLGVAALQTSEYFGTGRSPRPMGSAHPRNAPYQAYRASDTYFVIAAGNDGLWRQVAECVGLPELARDPRFLTQLDRATNQVELANLLSGKFEEHVAEYWLEEMNRRGVPAAPINDYASILSDPQVEAMGLVLPLTLPNGVETRTVGFPVRVEGHEFEIRKAPPRLGEHSTEIFEDWMD